MTKLPRRPKSKHEAKKIVFDSVRHPVKQKFAVAFRTTNNLDPRDNDRIQRTVIEAASPLEARQIIEAGGNAEVIWEPLLADSKVVRLAGFCFAKGF